MLASMERAVEAEVDALKVVGGGCSSDLQTILCIFMYHSRNLPAGCL